MRDKFVLGAAAGALVLLTIAGWLLLEPVVGSPTAAPTADPVTAEAGGSQEAGPSARPSAGHELVVDLEGGVAEPGIQQLPEGSRVADAIVAAGGYSADADVSAAARQLNLAALLTDGQQIYIPVIGESASGGSSPGASGGGSGGGLLNLNQATPEQLDALPGIGPVTVQKIVAARQEQPFRSLDELVERKVLTASQLAKIRDQVTV